jgi:MFS family permease
MFGVDRRVLALGVARMSDAIANSFLIVVLPLYLGAEGPVDTTALTGGSLPVLGPVTPELLIGVVLSLFGFLNSFSQPLTGRLSDRSGRRRLFILSGLAILAVASGLYSVVENYWLVLVIRAAQGLGAALTIPATVALVNELSATGTRGGNFGIFNAFRLLGFGTGPLVAGAVVSQGPYDLPRVGSLSGFDAAFGVAVVGAVAGFLLVTLLVDDPDRTEAAAADDLSIAVRDPDGGLDPVFTLGVATVLMAVGIALYATLANRINARLGQGEFLFSVQFAVTVLANVVLQPLVGRWSDGYGRRPFIVGGFVLLVPSTLAQGLVTSPGAMILARVVQGVGVAMVFAPSLAIAGDLAREGASGSTLSILTMGFGLGTAVGPLVSGVLVSFGFPVPFVFATGLAVVGLVLVYTQVEETVDLNPPAEPGPAPAED